MDFRFLELEELSQAVALADAIFRKNGGKSMGDSFPSIFQPGIGHSVGAFHEERLVSFVGLVPQRINVGPAALRVFSMGAVCTDIAYRGQGLAGKLVAMAKRHAIEAGASLLFVSGTRSLYVRADCYKFGAFRRFQYSAVTDQSFQAADGKEVRLLESRDLFRMHELAAARTVTFEQSVSELQLLLHAAAYASCSGMLHQTWVAYSEEEMSGYVILAVSGEEERDGRGAFVVEWGGKPDSVTAIVMHAIKQAGHTDLHMKVGWHEEELADQLRAAGWGESLEGNSGTVCVLDSAELFRQAVPYWEAEHGLTDVSSSFGRDGMYEVRQMGRNTAVTASKLVELLFQPRSGRWEDGDGLPPIPLPYMSGLHFI
ncbi:GNAT family N-acetyltransferase [Paenibacillus chungangensis]|uniref:GNAT family N-acetyltransferase n=1 Tax=Paenibacillus chungangensis TaxID=696535 RepID=A0ABW3HX60_9BACL